MDKRLVFTTSTEIVRVPSDTVVYITADGNYSVITLTDGENFVLTLQLGQIERRIAEMLVGSCIIVSDNSLRNSILLVRRN